jgi:hypothetical protein
MQTNKTLAIGLTLALVLLVTAGIGQAQGPAQHGQTAVEAVGVVTTATALDTSITYQGRLTDGGSPGNGKYDLVFLLRDGPSSGNLVGNAVELDDVVVADGLFTVQLDFGPGAFNGDARWLQIGVRPWDSYGAHAELLPWQPLTTVPYAQFAQTIYRLTVVVKPVGTPAENGAALLAALAGITDATVDNPYLLKLEPGQYDVGTTSLKMKEYVDIEGSGELATKIVGTGSSTSDTGTVWGANNAELRSLTVSSSGNWADWATAIYNLNVSPRLTHVKALASQAGASVGVRNENANSEMTNVTAIATALYAAAGVTNMDCSPTMVDVTAKALSSDDTYGIYNDNASPTMRGVTANAERATDEGYGVYNRASSEPQMIDVTASATSSYLAYGVYNDDSHPTMNNVIASADGDFAGYGVYNTTDSVVIMDHVTASSSGAGANYGVINMSGAVPAMRHVTVSASGGTFTCGVCNDTSSPTMSDVVITAERASGSNYGVKNFKTIASIANATISAAGSASLNVAMDNDESFVEINNSTLNASGATDNHGVFNSSSTGAYTVTINNSQITVPSTDPTIRSDDNFTIKIGASLLSGGNIDTNGGGTVKCVGVYDENYAVLYTGSCP